MRHVEWIETRTLGEPEVEKEKSTAGSFLLWGAVIGGVAWLFFKTISPV